MGAVTEHSLTAAILLSDEWQQNELQNGDPTPQFPAAPGQLEHRVIVHQPGRKADVFDMIVNAADIIISVMTRCLSRHIDIA
jgi:hypothetical protein